MSPIVTGSAMPVTYSRKYFCFHGYGPNSWEFVGETTDPISLLIGLRRPSYSDFSS